MENTATLPIQKVSPVGPDFFVRLWEHSWTYIKTIVDVVREPVLILDKDLRIMAANEPFYQMFRVEKEDTEGQIVYELGNGQWNIPALRKLLEDILPKSSFFKGFEVAHDFPFIGKKVMILNARKIHFQDDPGSDKLPSIIMLAIEDVTEIMLVAETLATHSNSVEEKFMKRTQQLEVKIEKLEKEIQKLKNKS